MISRLCYSAFHEDLWGDDAEGTGIKVSGRIAYVPQRVMLMDGRSVRENILCGLPFDAGRYEQAMTMSTLIEDVAGLRAGDEDVYIAQF